MMRIVLDTNDLFPAILRNSIYHPIYRGIVQRRFEIVVNTEIMLEYEEIIAHKLGTQTATATILLLRNSPNVIRQEVFYNWNLISADPDDNKFVDVAIASNADFIVTDDRHFNILHEIPYPKVAVVTGTTYLAML
jgi:uncharacterized protein